MLSRSRFFILSLLLLTVSSVFARSILEKKMYYLTNSEKIGQARFWVVYLGNFDCKINRKFPGEPEQPVEASMNIQFLSSGYLEGNGYSAKGKIDCLPTMLMSNESGEKQVTSDSIDCIYDYGRKIRLITGEEGNLIINVEGDKKESKKFLMREYKLTNYFGEEILKEGSEETPLAAFSYSKEGIARAKSAQAKLDADK